ncbi:MAG: hypothetical protein JWN15_4388 [Firmicutes bacterium]|nr:hypothetical protein [Bacillota bacterium]
MLRLRLTLKLIISAPKRKPRGDDQLKGTLSDAPLAPGRVVRKYDPGHAAPAKHDRWSIINAVPGWIIAIGTILLVIETFLLMQK